MMKILSRITTVLCCLVVILSVSLIFAADGMDDQGNLNDPSINARANACFEGGSMEDKCETLWEWTCGWYAIRYDEALLSATEIPAYCNSLIFEASYNGNAFPGCVRVGDEGYLNFGNQLLIEQPYFIFPSPDCLGVGGVFTGASSLVYASNPDDAEMICRNFNPSYGLTATYDNIWACSDFNIRFRNPLQPIQPEPEPEPTEELEPEPEPEITPEPKPEK